MKVSEECGEFIHASSIIKKLGRLLAMYDTNYAANFYFNIFLYKAKVKLSNNIYRLLLVYKIPKEFFLL